MPATCARLTNRPKVELRAHRIARPDLTHKQLAEWAMIAFQLPRAPSRMTIHRVVKAQDDDALHPEHKSNRSVCCPELGEVGAMDLQLRGVEDPDPAAKILTPLSLSNGWLCRFQKRHRLTPKRIHGEARSVKTASVEDGRAVLRVTVNGCARRDIYNMGEIAYFYCVASSRTVATKCFSACKSSKEKMTVAVACNADGSFKLLLLFIGKGRRPRCCKGKSPTELGVEYVGSAMGWTNSKLLQGWVKRFNDKMRAENWHVLLPLDNVSSHRLEKPLSNVTLHMLPPNIASYLQPQDAGIIQQFDKKISQLQNRYLIDKFDALLARVSEASKDGIEREIEALRHADALEAMRWAKDAWELVTKITIANCWRHTGIFELVERVDHIQLSECYDTCLCCGFFMRVGV